MGIDIRVGKGDHFTRYRVYKTRIDIHDKIAHSKNFVGILHAKDMTAYDNSRTRTGGFQADVTRATIETTDKIELMKDYALYCLPERTWYTIDRVMPNSHNESQQFSSRPINTTLIEIRR